MLNSKEEKDATFHIGIFRKYFRASGYPGRV
jgi:hypothetical protein